MTKLSTLRWAAKGEAGRGGGGSDCVVTPRHRRETESQPPRAAVCTAGRGRTVSSSRDRSAGGAQTHHPGPSCAVVLRPPTMAPRAEGATRRVPKPLGALHGTREGPSAHRAGRRRNGPREGEGAGRRVACVRAGPRGPRRSGVHARAAKTGRGPGAGGPGQAAVACRPQGIQDQGQAVLLPRWQTSNSPGCLR